MTDKRGRRQQTFVLERPDIKVSIYELFKCLGQAMDLVHPGLVDHHKRTAFIAASIANEMELPCEEQKNVLLAALIHDAGAFSLREKLDVARFDSEDVFPHCMAGYLLFADCPSLGEIAEIVKHHHVRGAYINGTESEEVAVPKTSHLLHLADRVAASLGGASEPLSLGREIVNRIRDESGIMLDHEMVQIFEEVAARNAFWFDVTSLRLEQLLDGLWRCSGDGFETIDLSEIEYLFSRIIDFRSHFTASHSRGVAAIAERVGQLLGFADGTNRMLCAAGHLHDLGKLAVPTEILEKAGSLTVEEMDIIRIHPYHTLQVLRAVDNLHEVKIWSAYHHECLDGSGYPFHLRADDLTTEARILAVADVFQALCEDRPYRSALPRTDAIRIFDNLARNSKLDRNIVAVVMKHFGDLDALRREVQKRVAAEYDQLSDSLGKKLWEIGAFKDTEACKRPFADLQEKGYARYEDLSLETGYGRSIAVEFVSNSNPGSGKTFIQSNIRDITDRERTEEALRRSEALLKEAERVAQKQGGRTMN